MGSATVINPAVGIGNAFKCVRLASSGSELSKLEQPTNENSATELHGPPFTSESATILKYLPIGGFSKSIV